ncbi:hypothetical protein ABBQ32_006415 [Trebouxia sp. C0010 RCD-2024]
MVTVAQFIDSIEHLTSGGKAALKRHVQMDEFGANLDADCDELFKEALHENLPATFNALERTAVKRILKHPANSRVEQTLLQFKQEMKEEMKEEIKEEVEQQTGKRHKTGFTETPIHLADGE